MKAHAAQRPAPGSAARAAAADHAPSTPIRRKVAADLARDAGVPLPDQLRTGVESLSGHSLDDVRVHYNSAEPARLNALSYAQGTEIHLAPGQESQLEHETWQIVQQATGRARPTLQE